MTAPWESAPRARFLSLFGRVTSSGRFIAEIDGMRFLAIGGVVLYHVMLYVQKNYPNGAVVPSVLRRYADHGWFGVELFFVISGFILAQPFLAQHAHHGRPVSLRKYFMRRLTRLEPPYIIATVAVFALRVLVNHQTGLAPHLAAALVYMHSAVFGSMSPIIGGTWSLEIEVQFYLLVPLFARVFRIRDGMRRRTVIVATMVAAALLQETTWDPRLLLTLLNYIQFFLAGFLLADLYMLVWNEKPVKSFAWDAIGIAAFALLIVLLNNNVYYFSRPELPLRLISPFVILALYCAIFRGIVLNWVFTRLWITTIGGMCYSIYLLHNTIIGGVGPYTLRLGSRYSFDTQLLVQLAVLSAVIVVVSAIFFVLAEKPFMRADWVARLKAWRSSLPARTEPSTDRP